MRHEKKKELIKKENLENLGKRLVAIILMRAFNVGFKRSIFWQWFSWVMISL